MERRESSSKTVIFGAVFVLMMNAAVSAWADDAASDFLARQSGPQGSGPEFAGADPYGGQSTQNDVVYLLDVGDQVKITIYPEDNYIKGGEMEVSSEGYITLSLVGKVQVRGKTAIQAERAIAEILDRDYLVDPEVVIEVTKKYAAEEEKTVVLLGQVRAPGTYTFPQGDRFTLLEAIALAGGFSDIANIKKIKVVREQEGQSRVIRANGESIISGKKPDVVLENGDIIHVTESLF